MRVDPASLASNFIPACHWAAKKLYPYGVSTLSSIGRGGIFVACKAGPPIFSVLEKMGKSLVAYASVAIFDYTKPEDFAENFEKDPSRVICGFLHLLKKNPEKAEGRLRGVVKALRENPKQYHGFTASFLADSLLLKPDVLAAKDRLVAYEYEGDLEAAQDVALCKGAEWYVNYFINFCVNRYILENPEIATKLYLADVAPEKNLHQKPLLTLEELVSRIATPERIEGLKMQRKFMEVAKLWRGICLDLQKAKMGCYWRVIDSYPKLRALINVAAPLLATNESVEALQPVIARLIGEMMPHTNKTRLA